MAITSADPEWDSLREIRDETGQLIIDEDKVTIDELESAAKVLVPYQIPYAHNGKEALCMLILGEAYKGAAQARFDAIYAELIKDGKITRGEVNKAISDQEGPKKEWITREAWNMIWGHQKGQNLFKGIGHGILHLATFGIKDPPEHVITENAIDFCMGQGWNMMLEETILLEETSSPRVGQVRYWALNMSARHNFEIIDSSRLAEALRDEKVLEQIKTKAFGLYEFTAKISGQGEVEGKTVSTDKIDTDSERLTLAFMLQLVIRFKLRDPSKPNDPDEYKIFEKIQAKVRKDEVVAGRYIEEIIRCISEDEKLFESFSAGYVLTGKGARKFMPVVEEEN